MKKKINIIMLIIIFAITLSLYIPKTDAMLYIAPMKMQAEGTIGENGYCEIVKVFKLLNKNNETIDVKLNFSGIDVIFNESIIRLQPNEEKIIYPTVIVKEGINEGFITISEHTNDDDTTGIGSSVTADMSITVRTIGHPPEQAELGIFPFIAIIIFFIIIGGVISCKIFIKKQKKLDVVKKK
jgi:uncharacterized protein YpmB